jgi:CheY-like chemotaxis protein
MSILNFQTIQQDPYRSGILTGFFTLCAIAFVNLIGNLFFEMSSQHGALLLVMALFASVISGVASAYSSKKTSTRRQVELKVAKSLAIGDFSNASFHPENGHTELSTALIAIADRQLSIERNNGQLIQEAAARESQLLTALDCASQEIALFDKNGLLVCANSAYLSKCNTIGAIVALGMTRKEVCAELAKAPRANLPLNERQSWFKAQEDLRQEAATSKMPVRFVRLNNELAQISVHSTKDGHQVEIIEDIGYVSALELRMQKAERETLASSRIKQVTLSRLSHTIRTPMTGVLAAAELLSDTTLDDKQRARLDIIRRSAGTLLGVVQDMFDMAEMPEQSMLKKAEIQNDGHIDTYETASTAILQEAAYDPLLEKQETVMPNYFSHRPDLKLFAELSSQTDHPEKLSDIFEATHSEATKHPEQLANLDLLIVESNEVNQIYVSNSLENSGFVYKIVGTGAQAIEVAKASKPRLILMDISIPDIDGLQVTAAIRQNTQNQSYAPIIIGMANHFLHGDLTKCLNAGMDQYLAKPATTQALLSLLDDWLKPEPLKMVS